MAVKRGKKISSHAVLLTVMSLLRQFPHSRKYPPLPDIFPSPFADVPHALAQQAAMLLQQELSTQAPSEHDFHARDSGKMMGVLVVQGEAGELGYLQGFSGKLAGKWQLPGFVPPIFDAEALDKFLPQGEQRLAQLTQEIIAVADGHDYISACEKVAEIKFSGEQAANALRLTLIAKKAKRKAERESLKERLEQGEQATALARLSQESQDDRREKQAMKKKCAFQLQQAQATLTPFEVRLESLETQRTVLSKTLHAEIFSHYQLLSTNQEHKPMSSFYMDHSPPGGSGDCAAPKLIQYANNVGLKPLALAEFWWGAAPAGGVRHHGVFYASCRGKCRPILPFMLKGLDIAPEPQPFLVSKTQSLDIVFEDEYLVVINKPVGLLSVPGGEVDDSAYSRLRHRYPKATGPLVVHRLDLATSGLLLAAKTSKVHKHLQQQFIHRQIKKR